MSEELKNIFNDFDPGVSDQHVDQRWEAIRPLLPAEDGPKGFVFLRRNGTKRVLAIAALLLLVSVASVLFFLNRSSEQVASSVNPISPDAATTKTDANPEKISQPLKSNETNRSHTPSVKDAGETERTISHNDTEKDVGSVPVQKRMHGRNNENVPANLVISGNPRNKKEDQASIAGNENQTPPSAAQPVSETKNEDAFIKEEFVFLTPVQYSPEPSIQRDAVNTFNEIWPKPRKPSGKWSLELFVGADGYNNSFRKGIVRSNYAKLSAVGGETPEMNKGITWVVGAAAYRSLGSRFFIPVQLLYSGSQDVSREESHGAIRITRPVSTSLAPDSTVWYREFTEILEIREQSALRAGLGLGIRLFASPLFTLNTMVLAEVNHATYVRTNELTFSETETTNPAPSSYPQPQALMYSNTSQGYDPNSSKTYTKNNYGATGALHAARSIGHGLAITSRLSYHYGFLKTDLPGKYNPIEFRSKDLMLTLGINYRW